MVAKKLQRLHEIRGATTNSFISLLVSKTIKPSGPRRGIKEIKVFLKACEDQQSHLDTKHTGDFRREAYI
jgi:hypothetical protein